MTTSRWRCAESAEIMVRIVAALFLALLAQASLAAQRGAKCKDMAMRDKVDVCYLLQRESELRAAQTDMLRQIRLTLEKLDSPGADAAEAIRHFNRAQRHWEKYAENECAVGLALYGFGTGRGMDGLMCNLKYLEDRNRYLVQFLDDYKRN